MTLRRITSGADTESTFLEWQVDFSKDAGADVIADAAFKIKDAFPALRAEAAKTFNYYSTAESAAKACLAAAGLKDLRSQTVLITGGNIGLGLETARVLVGCGARVIVTTRDEKKAAATLETLSKMVPAPVHKPEAMVCALDSFASIRAFAAEYIQKGYPIHTLILVSN